VVIPIKYMAKKTVREPPISFRLTKENRARLDDLTRRMNLANRNMTLNAVITNYSEYEKNRELLHAVLRLKELFK